VRSEQEIAGAKSKDRHIITPLTKAIEKVDDQLIDFMKQAAKERD
jgi:hypothetical protein